MEIQEPAACVFGFSQTVEAINHAKAAEVPIIIAITKIDKEAAVILNDGDAFGRDPENDKVKEKKRKERDKKQKALLDKLNELGISNLDVQIKTPTKADARDRGGMERKDRIR